MYGTKKLNENRGEVCVRRRAVRAARVTGVVLAALACAWSISAQDAEPVATAGGAPAATA